MIIKNINKYYEFCIVGAGPSGISLAIELSKSSKSVLLIPGGKKKISREYQNLYSGSSNLNRPLNSHRLRIFGGTSRIWGGRCIPFDDVDFIKRPYIKNSAWPIKKSHLDDYYKRSCDYLDIGDYNFCNVNKKIFPDHIEGFKSDVVITENIEKFSKPTDFGKKYYKTIKRSKYIDLLEDGHFISFKFKNNSEIEYLNCKRKDVSFSVKSEKYILAAGGIENARLLLQPTKFHPNGVGNQSGNVGKYFMSHLSGIIADIIFKKNVNVNYNYFKDDSKVYCRKRIQLSKKAIMDNKLLNFSSFLHHPPIEDHSHKSGLLSLIFLFKGLRYISSRIPPEYNSRMFGDHFGFRDYIKHIKNIFIDLTGTLYYTPIFVFQRVFTSRKIPSIIMRNKNNIFSLHYHVEHEPMKRNSITLMTETDDLGIRKPRVYFKPSNLDIQSIIRSHKLIDKELRKNKIGYLKYRTADLKKDIQNQIGFGGHLIGTTRMGKYKSTSVVDINCKVHDVNNLYITSSSVFPTGGQANPVMTSIALSLRLADHLLSK